MYQRFGEEGDGGELLEVVAVYDESCRALEGSAGPPFLDCVLACERGFRDGKASLRALEELEGVVLFSIALFDSPCEREIGGGKESLISCCLEVAVSLALVALACRVPLCSLDLASGTLSGKTIASAFSIVASTSTSSIRLEEAEETIVVNEDKIGCCSHGAAAGSGIAGLPMAGRSMVGRLRPGTLISVVAYKSLSGINSVGKSLSFPAGICVCFVAGVHSGGKRM